MAACSKVPAKVAAKVHKLVKKQHAAYIAAGYDGPTLVENWDWLGNGGYRWSVVWEEGPYEWAINFPFGGPDPEFGGTIPDVSDGIPATVYAEAITSWAVGIAEAN
jgi:hypothetical protein